VYFYVCANKQQALIFSLERISRTLIQISRTRTSLYDNQEPFFILDTGLPQLNSLCIKIVVEQIDSCFLFHDICDKMHHTNLHVTDHSSHHHRHYHCHQAAHWIISSISTFVACVASLSFCTSSSFIVASGNVLSFQ